MNSTTQAQALAQAGRRLHQEARAHMRSARFHRRRAAELHEQVDTLRQQCAEFGIELILEDPEPTPKEAQADEHHHARD